MKPDGEHCIRFSNQFTQEFKSSAPATASKQNSESRLFRPTGQIAPRGNARCSDDDSIPTDEYTAFARRRIGTRPQMMICFRKCFGEVTVFAYSLLTKTRSAPLPRYHPRLPRQQSSPRRRKPPPPLPLAPQPPSRRNRGGRQNRADDGGSGMCGVEDSGCPANGMRGLKRVEVRRHLNSHCRLAESSE